ncbi:uncharacterized protein LOC107481237 [Arachis duranensis]|uniref:Uncharacterized protein LOC107481237 n=1 Tax=Arachis duranensis TaxID=130453 RepID=A0A6P5NEB9_ARADU|nr:uncharacterized protein LOC107481237 [Arachis duranensis]XP_052110793.1 uncharacterized protein LOC107481237 [Arachis duranensis]XP_052110797.1 uncharacterized protein LOC107481237 [Arachis duranensis]XP_052110799.1 uncharacterized protein LOC107481237 [Arachis duranensis]XP_052110800.1 uncharacterized protein LOC107481237 [Arachis duranensis]
MKQVKLSVKEDMKPPNGRKIVLRFNEILQPVEAEAGILSGVLGLLGSNYNKFLIYEKDRRKVRFKDKIYNKCVKEMFHFDEDSGGKIKRTILKMLGRAWKETRNRLYHSYYDSQLTLEQNIEGHLSKLLWIIGDGTLIIATMKRQRRSVGKMLRIDQSSYTLTLADRKGWQGSEKKSRNDKGGELVEKSCGP